MIKYCKIFSVIFAAVLIFSFTSCSKNDNESEISDSTTISKTDSTISETDSKQNTTAQISENSTVLEDETRQTTIPSVTSTTQKPTVKIKDNSVNVKNKGYVAAYKKYLTDILENTDINPNNVPCFSLHYLDSDGIPELFFSHGESHVNSVTILTYDGEKVVNLGDFGNFGTIGFEERTGTLVETSNAKQMENATVYKFKNGAINEYWYGTHFLGGYPTVDTEEHYISNGQAVDQAKYEHDLVAYMPNVIFLNKESALDDAFPMLTFKVVGDEHKITTENIEKYIK